MTANQHYVWYLAGANEFLTAPFYAGNGYSYGNRSGDSQPHSVSLYTSGVLVWTTYSQNIGRGIFLYAY